MSENLIQNKYNIFTYTSYHNIFIMKNVYTKHNSIFVFAVGDGKMRSKQTLNKVNTRSK